MNSSLPLALANGANKKIDAALAKTRHTWRAELAEAGIRFMKFRWLKPTAMNYCQR